MKVPISLICCTHNGAKKIPKLLKSFLKMIINLKKLLYVAPMWMM